MSRLEKLEQQIICWGLNKGILPNPNPIAQLHKTDEEVGELADAIRDNNRAEAIDAIGDIIVTLVMQCQHWNVSLETCVAQAYDVISKRTGKMVDGQFVKDGE